MIRAIKESREKEDQRKLDVLLSLVFMISKFFYSEIL